LPLLMDHFLSSFGRRYGREVPTAPPHVLESAAVYPWPGNVRELRNLCERAVLMGWRSVEPILCAREREGGAPVAAEFELPFKDAKHRLIERFERQYIERLLERHQGRVGEVARAMGLAERNLYDKIKASALSRDDYR
jgi:two-component system response regulator AtoC